MCSHRERTQQCNARWMACTHIIEIAQPLLGFAKDARLHTWHINPIPSNCTVVTSTPTYLPTSKCLFQNMLLGSGETVMWFLRTKCGMYTLGRLDPTFLPSPSEMTKARLLMMWWVPMPIVIICLFAHKQPCVFAQVCVCV